MNRLGCITKNYVRYSERKNQHETPKHLYAAPINTALPLDSNAPPGECCLDRDGMRAGFIGRVPGPLESNRDYTGCAIADASCDDQSICRRGSRA